MPSMIEIAAILGCRLEGDYRYALLLMIEMGVVNRNEFNVTMPRYIIRGLPNIR